MWLRRWSLLICSGKGVLIVTRRRRRSGVAHHWVGNLSVCPMHGGRHMSRVWRWRRWAVGRVIAKLRLVMGVVSRVPAGILGLIVVLIRVGWRIMRGLRWLRCEMGVRRCCVIHRGWTDRIGRPSRGLWADLGVGIITLSLDLFSAGFFASDFPFWPDTGRDLDVG